MMGGKTPETCWAVNKRQDNRLENCCIWLVIYLTCTMMHGLTNLKCTFTVLLFALKSRLGFKYSRSVILLVPSRFCCPKILNSWLISRKPLNIGVHISVWYNTHYRFYRILATGVQWIINLLCFSRGKLFSYNSNCSKTGTVYQSICLTPHKTRTFINAAFRYKIS